MNRHQPEHLKQKCYSLKEIICLLNKLRWDKLQRNQLCSELNDFWTALDAEAEIRNAVVLTEIPNEQ